MAETNLKINVQGEVKQAQSAFNQVRNALKLMVKGGDEVTDSSKKAGKTATRAFRSMADGARGASKQVSGIAVAIGNARTAFIGLQRSVVVGVYAVQRFTNALNDLSKAWSHQLLAEKQLEAAWKSMGRSIPVDDIKAYASELQKTSTFGDELIIQASKMLATFPKITDEIFKESIKAMVEFASFGANQGVSLEQAARAIGKASMGLYGEVERTGITFSEATKQTKDFRSALNDIMMQVGGQTQATIETFTGRMQQLSNAWGDLKEQMGRILDIATAPIFEPLLEIVERLTEELKAMTEAGEFDELIASFQDLALTIVDEFGGLVEDIKGTLSDLKTYVEDIDFAQMQQDISAVANALRDIGSFIATYILPYWKEFLAIYALSKFANLASNLVGVFKSLGVALKVAFDRPFFRIAGVGIRAFFSGLLQGAKEVLGAGVLTKITAAMKTFAAASVAAQAATLGLVAALAAELAIIGWLIKDWWEFSKAIDEHNKRGEKYAKEAEKRFEKMRKADMAAQTRKDIESLKQAVRDLNITTLEEFRKTFGENAPKEVAKTIKALRNVVPSLKEEVVDKIKEANEEVIQAFKQMQTEVTDDSIANLLEGLQALGDKGKEHFKKLYEGAKENLKKLQDELQKVTDKIEEVKNKTAKSLRDLNSQFEQVQYNILTRNLKTEAAKQAALLTYISSQVEKAKALAAQAIKTKDVGLLDESIARYQKILQQTTQIKNDQLALNTAYKARDAIASLMAQRGQLESSELVKQKQTLENQIENAKKLVAALENISIQLDVPLESIQNLWGKTQQYFDEHPIRANIDDISYGEGPKGSLGRELAGGGTVPGGWGGGDIIPAWLTPGEFVMPLKAVQKYGTAFLEMIRTGSLTIKKYALGGLVKKASIPSFATGGIVGSTDELKFEITRAAQGFSAAISDMLSDAAKKFDELEDERYYAALKAQRKINDEMYKQAVSSREKAMKEELGTDLLAALGSRLKKVGPDLYAPPGAKLQPEEYGGYDTGGDHPAMRAARRRVGGPLDKQAGEQAAAAPNLAFAEQGQMDVAALIAAIKAGYHVTINITKDGQVQTIGGNVGSGV